MILTPKCSLSFFTLLWLKKRIDIVRRIHFDLLVSALLATSLVLSKQLKYQEYRKLCILCAQKLCQTISKTQIAQANLLASLSKRALTYGYFQVWLPFKMTRSPRIFQGSIQHMILGPSSSLQECLIREFFRQPILWTA